MALLSMATVTFSDAVGESNKTLLMQLCRQDGVVLKPDRPATAIDAQFQAMMFGSWPGDSSDESGCLATAAARTTSGAVQLSEAAIAARAEALFPGGQGGLSAGRRRSLAVSAALVEQIEHRQAALQECTPDGSDGGSGGRYGYGSPQSATGEIYSTHTTVSGYTWRYVVGVQVAVPFNVTAGALGISDSSGGKFVSYTYSDSAMWRVAAAADVKPFGGQLLVDRSPQDMCQTGQQPLNVSTRCFGFELQTVAPVTSNGWTLLGETDKFLPVSNQRIESVQAVAAGGFRLVLKGQVGEAVTMGAVDVKGGAAPVFVSATIGAGGTAELLLK